jgi:hypothetical protein
MSRLLDRIPIPMFLIGGVVLGALAFVLNLLFSGSSPNVNWVFDPAVIILIVLLAVWAVALLRWLYYLAFIQPQRSIPADRPILRLLKGLLNVALVSLALTVVSKLLPPWPLQVPTSSELLFDWLIRGWLLGTAELIPILLLMRLLARPWRLLHARLHDSYLRLIRRIASVSYKLRPARR